VRLRPGAGDHLSSCLFGNVRLTIFLFPAEGLRRDEGGANLLVSLSSSRAHIPLSVAVAQLVFDAALDVSRRAAAWRPTGNQPLRASRLTRSVRRRPPARQMYRRVRSREPLAEESHAGLARSLIVGLEAGEHMRSTRSSFSHDATRARRRRRRIGGGRAPRARTWRARSAPSWRAHSRITCFRRAPGGPSEQTNDSPSVSGSLDAQRLLRWRMRPARSSRIWLQSFADSRVFALVQPICHSPRVVTCLNADVANLHTSRTTARTR